MSRREAAVAVAVLGCLGTSGCGDAPSEDEKSGAKPATVIKASGQPTKVSLTERAVERLGLRTVQVRQVGSGPAAAIAIPFTALLFDKVGKAATYVVVGPRTYSRTPVVVDHYDAELAVLEAGPPVGASVVTDGSAELSGTEAGLG